MVYKQLSFFHQYVEMKRTICFASSLVLLIQIILAIPFLKAQFHLTLNLCSCFSNRKSDEANLRLELVSYGKSDC